MALATRPAARGRGLASAVLDAVAARADAEGRAVFLEASANGVDAFYASRHGFEEVGALGLRFRGGGALRMPLMARRPRGGRG
jgi:ribosomal protein S18 acetylase RimI-like enzyme